MDIMEKEGAHVADRPRSIAVHETLCLYQTASAITIMMMAAATHTDAQAHVQEELDDDIPLDAHYHDSRPFMITRRLPTCLVHLLSLILVLLLVFFPSPALVHRLYSSEPRQQLLTCAGRLRMAFVAFGMAWWSSDIDSAGLSAFRLVGPGSTKWLNRTHGSVRCSENLPQEPDRTGLRQHYAVHNTLKAYREGTYENVDASAEQFYDVYSSIMALIGRIRLDDALRERYKSLCKSIIRRGEADIGL
ncbi:uncharacterized protein F5147DRAFT_770993 [Suillus discolor]|uniref:Uncharacterized protein n=1 Tax=Suillus discolor TaxID=1912936 RepID=A0A9P7JWT7_9AGAM|nr:uncharacterized protein F5147DRAFT_770993 [Suillus discolor]KAG2113134.1 hypothetical protein F5147DRAFT_770993 [Suillus discolor]